MYQKWKIKNEVLQITVALLMLFMGVLLYLTTRSYEQVLFIKYLPELNLSQQFVAGDIIYSIPSFLHIYAFILLSAAALSAGDNALRLICWFWLLLEMLFEAGQHPVFAFVIANSFSENINHLPWLGTVLNYFLNGRFDILDMLFLISGAVFAYQTVRVIRAKTSSFQK